MKKPDISRYNELDFMKNCELFSLTQSVLCILEEDCNVKIYIEKSIPFYHENSTKFNNLYFTQGNPNHLNIIDLSSVKNKDGEYICNLINEEFSLIFSNLVELSHHRNFLENSQIDEYFNLNKTDSSIHLNPHNENYLKYFCYIGLDENIITKHKHYLLSNSISSPNKTGLRTKKI